MLVVSSGKYSLYQHFELDIINNLHFYAGYKYLLKGVNGSGKTSFLQQILLPKLHNLPEQQYILFLEQQMRGQILAVKAHAAIHGYQHHLLNEEDVVEYLLYDLRSCLHKQIRKIFFIIDESTAAQPLRDFWDANRVSACMLEVTHGNQVDLADWNVIQFYLEKPGLAKVKAT